MLEKFNQNIKYLNLFKPDNRILLAVSGGIDSMVMAHMFEKSGYNYGIAHCNFSLRGEASDLDEVLVQEYSSKTDVPFYLKKFKTEKEAKFRKISIQMAARELRYEWFEELRNKHNYKYIAIAHNKDDVVETFLMNIARGTGIRGLSGIKVKKGNVIRPILFLTRTEIEEFQEKNNIAFREDSSNSSLKYSRNKIRHILIPELENLNPNFKNNLLETISYTSDAAEIFIQSIEEKKKSIIQEQSGQTTINIDSLKKLKFAGTYLYEFIKVYGFSKEVIPDIFFNLDRTSGKQFYSKTHLLIKDREQLIITSIQQKELSIFRIKEGVKQIKTPIHLFLEKEKTDHVFKPGNSKKTAYLDYDQLKFPLSIRKWEKGDKFQPLGLSHNKKLSDFFINEKVSLIEKEKTWLLVSNKNIIWVIGHRIDHRFRVQEKTITILKVELLD
ncbi:MAG: tRNA lysidine(34) synthetase TilS [Bacteroidota bacterium]|nr:tRNA lysidine(34) synthetase TilS [Bacteroidota bacterium]